MNHIPEIGTVYVLKNENPFERLYARICAISGSFVQYELGSADRVFCGAKASDSIAGFLNRYMTEDRFIALSLENGSIRAPSTGFNCAGDRMGAQQ